MDQQEEKKRKVYRRGRRQSKSTSSFPIDLTSEILLRLPVKSIVRFRCVSKLWSSITTDQYFINLFGTRSPPSLLLCIKKDDNLFVSSIPQHSKDSNESYSSSQPIDRYHMKLPREYSDFVSKKHSFFRRMVPVHGLMCFQDSRKPIVWNPSMRRFLTLTSPSESWYDIIVFLGYDPIEGKHKVVCIPYRQTCYECRILTLGSAEESWRTVKTNHEHRSYMNNYGKCIKGVIYYLAYTRPACKIIMSFDVRSEKFDMIELLSDIDVDLLMTYEGKLACVEEKVDSYGITLWILEDAEKHKWLRKDVLAPFCHYDRSLKTDYELSGATHAGEFIYVPPYVSRQPFYILFCDPVRNSSRRFELQGVVDDESGLHNQPSYRIHAFPSHIESLLSL